MMWQMFFSSVRSLSEYDHFCILIECKSIFFVTERQGEWSFSPSSPCTRFFILPKKTFLPTMLAFCFSPWTEWGQGGEEHLWYNMSAEVLSGPISSRTTSPHWRRVSPHPDAIGDVKSFANQLFDHRLYSNAITMTFEINRFQVLSGDASRANGLFLKSQRRLPEGGGHRSSPI